MKPVKGVPGAMLLETDEEAAAALARARKPIRTEKQRTRSEQGQGAHEIDAKVIQIRSRMN